MKQSNLRPQRPKTTRRIAGHAQQDHILDPYQRQQKLHEGTICSQCGAVYHNGRWQWASRPQEGAAEALCSACRRINDKFPAGIVIRSPSMRDVAEEAPGAYKDSTAVVETMHLAGLSRKVATIEPLSASRVKTDHGK